MIDNHKHFSVDLCSYYTAFEVEKVRTVNDIWPHRTTIECVGQCCFARGLHSVAQNKVWNHMNHPLINSTNTNKIWKESWSRAPVNVGLSIARPSKHFLIIVYTVNYIVTILWMLMTWRHNELGSSSAIVLSHLTRNILISRQEILIFWENDLSNGSAYHLLEMIHYIPSQWLAFQTNPNIPKELK